MNKSELRMMIREELRKMTNEVALGEEAKHKGPTFFDAFRQAGLQKPKYLKTQHGEVEVYQLGREKFLSWNSRTGRWFIDGIFGNPMGEGPQELAKILKSRHFKAAMSKTEEMRDGLPPKTPGRDKKANTYFNTAKTQNLAQGNKKYTAETKKKR